MLTLKIGGLVPLLKETDSPSILTVAEVQLFHATMIKSS